LLRICPFILISKRHSYSNLLRRRGTITTDLMEDCGLNLATLSDKTLDAVADLFPPWKQTDHPLDLWIAIERNGFEKVFRSSLNAVINDPAVDSIIFTAMPHR